MKNNNCTAIVLWEPDWVTRLLSDPRSHALDFLFFSQFSEEKTFQEMSIPPRLLCGLGQAEEGLSKIREALGEAYKYFDESDSNEMSEAEYYATTVIQK